jgi:hypothetical protein
LLLDEINSEKKWEKKFAETEDVLEKLAREALKEYEKGKTTALDVEKL